MEILIGVNIRDDTDVILDIDVIVYAISRLFPPRITDEIAVVWTFDRSLVIHAETVVILRYNVPNHPVILSHQNSPPF